MSLPPCPSITDRNAALGFGAPHDPGSRTSCASSMVLRRVGFISSATDTIIVGCICTTVSSTIGFRIFLGYLPPAEGFIPPSAGEI